MTLTHRDPGWVCVLLQSQQPLDLENSAAASLVRAAESTVSRRRAGCWSSGSSEMCWLGCWSLEHLLQTETNTTSVSVQAGLVHYMWRSNRTSLGCTRSSSAILSDSSGRSAWYRRRRVRADCALEQRYRNLKDTETLHSHQSFTLHHTLGKTDKLVNSV